MRELLFSEEIELCLALFGTEELDFMHFLLW
jgi:hypothetical protein